MKALFFVTLLALLVATSVSSAAQVHRFALGKEDFLLDGKPFRIMSGEMHPARIPRPYWRHRVRMAKAMGLNTVAAYVFWNYHEGEEGKFDFKSDNRDLAAFLRICQEEGMWVLLRPGPYCCGEWDFGGIPTYLLRYPDLKVRCMDPRY
ncbi:beta-galactosidase, partial [Leclercia adecarboxylata]|uniref:beta-galactosidase n=1 Tax=Leclercia adecarboxylata TaxID=83655 RepID=UPI00234C9143